MDQGEDELMPITGLSDIPSNFTVSNQLVVSTGASAYPFCPDVLVPGEGKLRFLCNPGHLSYDDPILYPGQEGAAHLHHFFGNSTTNYNSTYASLRAGQDAAGTPNTTGSDGTCAGKGLNRTGYWHPAMIKPASPGFSTPKVVVPSYIEMYYNIEPTELDDYTPPGGTYSHLTHKLRPFPNGLQMIFGWEHTHPIAPGEVVWLCDHPAALAAGAVRHRSIPELFNYLQTSVPAALTPPFGSLQARIGSPGCWDGDNLRAATTTPGSAGGAGEPSGYGPGRSHIAHTVQDGYSHAICPPTHPYRIPALLVIVAWPAVDPNDWKNWYMSVDRHTGHNLAGGNGFHTDWFGAWDPNIQDRWETNILALGTTFASHSYKSTSDGNLCTNDESLTQAHHVYTPPGTYLDIPPVPNTKRMRLNLTAA
jgi:hypothetical protein